MPADTAREAPTDIGERQDAAWRPTETAVGCVKIVAVDANIGAPGHYETRFRRTLRNEGREENTVGTGWDLVDAVFDLALKLQEEQIRMRENDSLPPERVKAVLSLTPETAAEVAEHAAAYPGSVEEFMADIIAEQTR